MIVIYQHTFTTNKWITARMVTLFWYTHPYSPSIGISAESTW